MKNARLAAPAALLLHACATASGVTVPKNLAVPSGAEKITLHAEGVQIYQCKQKGDDRDAFEWSLKAPDADLVDAAGTKAGRHYAGPTWEAADGSKVIGEVVEKSPAPGTIPWLLLKAKSTEGTGAFGDIAFIQRLETSGGAAPVDACDSSQAGQERRVAYSAVYKFFAR